MRSIAKCKSEIHHDSGSDIKAVRAGIDRKNIVMKPLSLPVMLSAIWYATRPIDAATIVPKIISIIAKIWPKWSSERRYKMNPTAGTRTQAETKKFAATAADSSYFENHLPTRVPPNAEQIGTGTA